MSDLRSSRKMFLTIELFSFEEVLDLSKSLLLAIDYYLLLIFSAALCSIDL